MAAHLGSDLVAALASLQVDDLAHLRAPSERGREGKRGLYDSREVSERSPFPVTESVATARVPRFILRSESLRACV